MSGIELGLLAFPLLILLIFLRIPIGLAMLLVALLIAVPEISTWLPSQMFST